MVEQETRRPETRRAKSNSGHSPVTAPAQLCPPSTGLPAVREITPVFSSMQVEFLMHAAKFNTNR